MFQSSYTVSHRSVRNFVALVVEGYGSSVAVQNPTHLYSRRDGRFTIRAADPRNTLTTSLHRVNVYGILPNGTRETLLNKGPRAQAEPEPLAPWERDLLRGPDPLNFYGRDAAPAARERNESSMREAIAALDNNVPDWYNRVDVDRLCMISSRDCILGQVYENEPRAYGESGYGHGLRVLGMKGSTAFANFDRTWREVILHRRATR